MAFQDKKFLDAEGITHLVRLLDEYPNNQVLGSVIDAIEGELEGKAEKSEIPEVPVQDVQVNGASILQDGVANVPVASTGTLGAVKINNGYGISIENGGSLYLNVARSNEIKSGSDNFKPAAVAKQHESVFYSLAKAAGADMKDIASTTVGIYPDAQKEAIQSMLGITQMLAPTNPNLVATQAYSIGDVFAANGHLYKATVAIVQDEAIIPDTNCVETTMAEAGGKIKDVQVNSVSVVGNDGAANVPLATNEVYGAVKGDFTYGVVVNAGGRLATRAATEAVVKTGTNYYLPLTASTQHQTVFYGLSKVAGVDLANETVTLGTYPETSKTAIKEMLGVQDGLKVVRLI